MRIRSHIERAPIDHIPPPMSFASRVLDGRRCPVPLTHTLEEHDPIPTKIYIFFAGPASQAEGEHALDMCSNAFSGGFRGSLPKKPILVSLIRHPRPYGDEGASQAS